MESGFTACISIITGVKSIYRWKNNIEENQEIMCFFKTAEDTSSHSLYRGVITSS
ncbi:hypothetical protein [Thermoplasma acidophilum]|uniref:Uncharacterized protein n=1 Tax=Thermoplasma acidophilum (strain ATCC 25905 / DSM 1728 / JCM 9062 / NBRC 15155 / AMRC-C165) TaxID=273075 RepID=Q9HLP0_THEAC|nr:hypothetical protein [Thermoplasma acidophilum]